MRNEIKKSMTQAQNYSVFRRMVTNKSSKLRAQMKSKKDGMSDAYDLLDRDISIDGGNSLSK